MGRYSRKQSFPIHGCRFVDRYIKANYQNPNEVMVFNYLDVGGVEEVITFFKNNGRTLIGLEVIDKCPLCKVTHVITDSIAKD